MRTGQPIRVLFVTGATSWGGAEIVLGHLIAGLGPRFEPTLIGVDADVVGRVAARRPGMAWSLMPRVRHRRDLRSAWAQRSALIAARPDLVHINLPVPFAEPLTLLAASTIPQVRLVLVDHLPMATGSRKVRLLRRLTAHRVAAEVAVGDRTARQVEELIGLSSGSVQAVPNGVPDPTPPSTTRPPGRPFVVGGIGRLHHQKGFDLLVRAIASVPDAQLVLVGDGPERGSLEQLAAALGVGGRLRITGWTDSPADELAGLDVVAVPSRFEGSPLVVLEAMMGGRAVVASPVGSIPDVVQDGHTALLTPVDDPIALAAALLRLRDDPALRTRLAATAAEVAGRLYSVTAMVAGYERIYDEVSRSGRRTRGRS